MVKKEVFIEWNAEMQQLGDYKRGSCITPNIFRNIPISLLSIDDCTLIDIISNNSFMLFGER